jgi:hypothetical protein
MNSKISVIASIAIGSAFGKSNFKELALSQASEGTQAALLSHETCSVSEEGSCDRRKRRDDYCGCGCGCECALDPRDNGCLCYEYEESYAWFVPADECGKCREDSLPVNTDHQLIYKWIAQFNVEGSGIVANISYTNESSSSRPSIETTDVNQVIVGGGGFDEFVNYQSLCMDLATGEVTPSNILTITVLNDVDVICEGELRSIFNA